MNQASSHQQKSPPDGASMKSSQASSHQYRFDLDNNKFYTQDERLQQAVKLFSTLQDKDQIYQEDIASSFPDNDYANSKRSIRADRNQDRIYRNGSDQELDLNKNIFTRLQAAISLRLFKLNHVLIENQVITPLMYFLIMVIELLQVLYFAFYHVNVINEFKFSIDTNSLYSDSYDPSAGDYQNQSFFENSTTSTDYAGYNTIDSSKVNSTLLESIYGSQNNTLDATSERVHEIFDPNQLLKFTTFPIVVLEQGTTHNYVILSVILNAIFVCAAGWLLLVVDRFYQEQLTGGGGLKDGSKMLVKTASVIITAYLTVLQVPMFLIYFQAYLCNEDQEEELTLDLECDTSNQRLIIGISTLGFFIYLAFIIIMKLLYTSSNFETTLPWACLDKKFDLLSSALKLILSASFIYDKNGLQTESYLHLISFLICFTILFRRLTSGIIIEKSIYYVSIVFETLMTWLFLTIGCHLLSQTEDTQSKGEDIFISTFALMIVVGIIIGVLLVFIQEIRHYQSLLDEKFELHRATSTENIQYFFRIFKQIHNFENNNNSQMILNGLLQMHLKECQEEQCQCVSLVAEKLDQVEMIELNLKELQDKNDGRSTNQENYDDKNLNSLGDITKRRDKSQNQANLKKTCDYEYDSNSALPLYQVLDDQLQSQSVIVSDKETNVVCQTPKNSGPNSKQEESKEKQHSLNSKKKLLSNSRHGTVRITPDIPVLPLNKPTNSIESISLHKSTYRMVGANDKSSKQLSTTNNALDLKSAPIINQRQNGFVDIGTSGTSAHEMNERIKEKNDLKQHEGMKKTMSCSSIQNKKDKEQDDLNFYFEMKPRLHQKYWYRFLSLYVQQSVHHFPKRIDLRIINSFLQQSKLENNFKATFDLMNCELLMPGLQDRFTIFRMKFDIEQQLITLNEKNTQVSGNIDALELYQYEKLFQRYSLLEYLTASSTLNFWRELLQRTVSTKVIKERGAEISQNYAKIEDISVMLFKINPYDIKFLYRFALFQKQIACNDSEALQLIEKAFIIYQGKVNKKQGQNNHVEVNSFGENTAPAIIMISTTSHQIGVIMYANEEINHILGFSPPELIGRNVQCLMPNTIGDHHDQFIINYLETAKSHVINQTNITFAVSKEGYLKPIKLLIKIYPHLNEKIVFIGMLQECDNSDEIIARSNSDIDTLDHQYIITDEKGFISTVTDGLCNDFGLNPKFFGYNGNNNANHFQFAINISMICPDIHDTCSDDVLENDGAILSFDTRELLNHVDLEALSHEEVIDVQSKLGLYRAQVQMKRIQYYNAKMIVYRISAIANSGDTVNSMNQFTSNNFKSDQVASNDKLKQSASIDAQAKMDLELEEDPHSSAKEFDLSSTTSTSTTGMGTLKSSINDFKRALSERRSSKTLRRLNLIIIIIVLSIIVLACVEFAVNSQLIDDLFLACEHSLKSQLREVIYILLATNIRTLTNIANHLEPSKYEGELMQDIDRFSYVSDLVQSQGQQLQEIIDFIDSQRQDTNSYHPTVFMNFENTPILLYRLDLNNKIFNYTQPYRQSFNTFLAFVQILNGTTQGNMSLPGFLIRGAPPSDYSTVFSETNQEEKDTAYLIMNQYRNILQMTIDANNLQQRLAFQDTQDSHFLIIMIVGILVSTASIIVLLHHIWAMEKVKADILALFALLNLKDIKRVFDDLDQYIDKLEHFQNGIALATPDIKNEQIKSDLITTSKQLISHQIASTLISVKDLPTPQMQQQFHAKKNQNRLDDSSEEMKDDEIAIATYLQKRRLQRQKELSQKKNQRFVGESFYEAILRDMKEQIRDIQEREMHFQKKKEESLNQTAHQKNHNYFQQTSQHQLNNEEMTQRALMMDETSSIQRTASASSKKGQNNKKKRAKNKLHKHSSKSVAFEIEEQDQSSENSLQEESTLVRAKSKLFNNKKKSNKTAAISDVKFQGNEDETDSLEHRKRMFSQQNQLGNLRLLILCCSLGIIVLAYFVYIYGYHEEQMGEIKNLKDQLPLFFDRYTDIALAYGFLRERIINNNSLSTFNISIHSFSSVNGIDSLFQDKALHDAHELDVEKSRAPSILSPITHFMKVADSEHFCDSIIGEYQENIEEKIAVTKNTQKELAYVKKQAYNFEIHTVIAACIAAMEGQVETLRNLWQQGVDLDAGNYDKRTPLHIACAEDKLEAVKFLVEEVHVKINPIDRWGATPFNDAQEHPHIASYLKDHGAYFKKSFPPAHKFEADVELDQYRLYYAAYYGDVHMMEKLRIIGWKLNAQDFDGRTALHIAASEGRLPAVKFLIGEGADVSIIDEKGNDALMDAVRENRTQTVLYLQSIINEALIKHACSRYQDGILFKGIEQAFGSFFKKMEDVQIAVSNTTSYHQLLSFLNPEITPEQANAVMKVKGKPVAPTSKNQTGQHYFTLENYTTTQRAMTIFITCQELYFHRIINRLAQVVQETTGEFISNYNLIAESVFFTFLAYQLVILLFLRRRLLYVLKREVFQSRGILNLIPWAFFEENREAFLSIVAKLKD